MTPGDPHPADPHPAEGPDVSGECVAVLAVGRGTFDVPFAQAKLAAALGALEATGARIVGPGTLLMDGEAVGAALDALPSADVTRTLLIQATITDAAATVRIAERHGDRPFAIWAFPEPREGGRLRLNAFCGLNLAAHALGLMDRTPGMLYAEPSPAIVPSLRELIAGHLAPPVPPVGPAEVDGVSPAAARALNAIHGARIGRLGAHPDGFDTCAYDERRLDALARVSVEAIELPEVFAAAGAASASAVALARTTAEADCGDLSAMDAGELDRSLRLHAALRSLKARGNYDAFAVRCWPECFTEHGGAMCAPVAMMGEARTPCACEADVYGALSSLLMQSLADAPAFLVDLVDLDPADGTGVVWHCGQAPISMAAGASGPTGTGASGPTGAGGARAAAGEPGEGTLPARARPTVHTNRRMALLYEFALRPGRVTLARISQARGRHQMVIATGEALERPSAFTGTSGVVRFDAPIPTVRDALLGGGVEHHTALAYGDHAQSCREVAAELGIPVLAIT